MTVSLDLPIAEAKGPDPNGVVMLDDIVFDWPP